MYNPVTGTVSSRYGSRTINGVRSFHAGLDIATGGKSVPVYAAFAGVVQTIVRGRMHDRSGDQRLNRGKPVLAPGRTPNGIIIRGLNSGGELYGHVKVLDELRVGQTIEEGQLLGYVDLSGNTSGYHLHFEVWSSPTNHGSHVDPEPIFAKYGVVPGTATARAAAHAVPLDEIQRRLQNTIDPDTGKAFYPAPYAIDGKGGPGSITDGAIRAWQRYRDLVADGQWGDKTETNWKAWGNHIHAIWELLQKLGYKIGADDHLYGPMMFAAARQAQADLGLLVDGDPGVVTLNALREAVSSSLPAPTPPTPVNPTPTPVEPVEELETPLEEPTPPSPPVVEPGAGGTQRLELPNCIIEITIKVIPKED